MARIRRHIFPHTVRVKVTGRLTAADVGRLEHACAPALLTRDVALEIDLGEVTESDEIADLIVDRMAARGARIKGPRPLHASVGDRLSNT
jgi:hypothetical protein